MPAILFLVIVGAGLALVATSKKGAPAGGAPPPGGGGLVPAGGPSAVVVDPATGQTHVIAPLGLGLIPTGGPSAVSPSGQVVAPPGVTIGPGGQVVIGPPPTPSPVPTPGVQHVTVATHDAGPSGNLNIRSAPSTSASIVASAPHGSVLAVTGTMVQGSGLNWFPVLQESSGAHGFAAAQYLKPV